MFKRNQKVLIIGNDPDFPHHVAAEPKPGVIGKYIGSSPVGGKLTIRFNETDLGYEPSDSPMIDLYIKAELVGELGTPLLPHTPPRPSEPVYEPVEPVDLATIDPEILAIWREVLKND